MKLTKRRKGIALAGGAFAFEAICLKRRSGSLFGLRTIVRCHRGHLFTTIWIPGASVKSVRLGAWRIQHCPVGQHWSIVTPVRRSKLDDAQRTKALACRDTFLP